MKSQILDQSDIAQGAFDEGTGIVGRRVAIGLQQILLDRAAVDPDPDGHLVQFGRGHHSGQLVAAAKIAGIDPDGLGPVLHGSHCQAGIKVDIGNERDGNGVAEGAQGQSRLHVRNRHPDEFATGGG